MSGGQKRLSQTTADHGGKRKPRGVSIEEEDMRWASIDWSDVEEIKQRRIEREAAHEIAKQKRLDILHKAPRIIIK